MSTLVFVLVISGLVGSKAASAAATSDKLYYKGKVITMWVGSGAGGGTDVWCRLVARHLGRHIPGNPAVVIRNNPAGGGLIAANTVWASRPDGLNMIALGGKIRDAELFTLVDVPVMKPRPRYAVTRLERHLNDDALSRAE